MKIIAKANERTEFFLRDFILNFKGNYKMRAVVQRVKSASVSISDQIIGECEIGALILVCAMKDDTVSQVEKLAKKITKIRIYQDEDHKMNQIGRASCRERV